MAAVSYSPIPTELEDPVTLREASALLARTGHTASVSTIARWNLRKVRVGRTDYVSWSEVLDEHFRRTAAKLRCSSNWP